MAEQERSYSSISSDLGSNRNKVVTKKTTTVVPYDINSGVIPPPGTQEEWTTTKRRINHKTKQVETRVQRQIIMEDGKVIADSGPQVTTKTTEDQKSDESEDTKHRKLGDSEVPEKYRKDIGNQVVAEKTVTHNVTKEAKEENYQYHDESLRELDGPEIHRKAVEAPHKLISIENEIPSIPRGKLVHFSAKGKKTNDRDEILEVSRLDKDGMLNTETTQTQYHEELEDDEVPEDGPRMLERENSDHHTHRHELEYGGGQDHDRSSRNSSSLSMSRGQEKMKKSKRGKDTYSKRRDPQSSTSMIGDDDIVETSEVYRLSDRMRSLKTNKKNTKGKSTRKDDASTQASMSDLNSGDENEGHRHSSTNAEHLHEVHERFGSRRSSFHTHDDECCDLMVHKPGKHKQQYYYGTESAKPATTNGDEKGFISANVKTSKFAMENDRVIEDKNFEEDFERSFKDKAEKFDVRRDYDRFLERTMEPTKAIRDRATSPKLPPSGSSTSEFIHRPVLVGSSDQFEPYSDSGKPARSRSFYNHQIDEYENSKTRKSYDQATSTPLGSGYSSLPYRDPFGSSHRVSSPSNNSGTWTKHTTRDHSHRYDSHRSTTTGTGDGKFRQSSGRSDFPDFAPLSSPYEIKSLSENSMKTRHLTSYN